MKGYLTNKRVLREMMETKVQHTYEFFNTVKDSYRTTAAIKIQFALRKWMKRIKKEREQQKTTKTKKNNTKVQSKGKPTGGNPNM